MNRVSIRMQQEIITNVLKNWRTYLFNKNKLSIFKITSCLLPYGAVERTKLVHYHKGYSALKCAEKSLFSAIPFLIHTFDAEKDVFVI